MWHVVTANKFGKGVYAHCWLWTNSYLHDINEVKSYDVIKLRFYDDETSELICIANPLTGFYMMGTLLVNVSHATKSKIEINNTGATTEYEIYWKLITKIPGSS